MTLPYELALVVDGRAFVISMIDDFYNHYTLDAGGERSLFNLTLDNIDKLIGKENILINYNFTDQVANWNIVGDLPATVSFSTNFSDDTRLGGFQTAYLTGRSGTTPVTITYNDPIFGENIPVIGGRTYSFEGVFAAHRAIGSVDIIFSDEKQTILSTLSLPLTEHKGGPELTDCQRVSITGISPLGSCNARISIRFLRSHNQVRDMNFFLFFTNLSFAAVDTSILSFELETSVGWTRGLLSIIAGYSRARLFDSIFDIETLNRTRSSIAIVPIDQSGEDRLTLYDTSAALNNISASFNFEGGKLIHVNLEGTSTCSLFCDGERISHSMQRTAHNSVVFKLPEKLLDGQSHLFDIRDSAGITILARDYLLIPNVMTPWHLIQEHSAPRVPFHMAPAASSRYHAIQKHLEFETSGQLLKQLHHVHEVVSIGFDVNRQFLPLHFPYHLEPKVSIVIPVHNKFEVTYFCLCALLLAFNHSLFELIVVDDGSSDRTLELNKIVDGISVVRNEAALGFIGACNRGAEAARGEFIVFLNNDTEPTAGWLDELVESFEIFENVGMAGSKLIYPNGLLQEAGGIVWSSGNPWNYGRGQNALDPRYNYTRDADYLSGAAIMLPANIWSQVGGFSTEFMPAYFEDVDLAFKVRDLGYRTLYVSSSIVYHFEGITGGTDVSVGAKRNQEINRPKFKSKWISAYRGHGKEGVSPDLEKDRGISGRVLFVDYRTPKPDSDAGSYAAIQEMRLVQGLGYKVSFFPQNACYLGRHTEYLQKIGVETLHGPFYLSIDDVLQRNGQDYDAIYMIRYYVTRSCLDAARRWAPQAKLIMNNCDLHFLRELRSGIANRNIEQIEKSNSIRDEELSVMRDVDLTLSYNDVEHAVIMSHNADKGRVMRVPWVESLTKTVPSLPERAGAAFLGGFNHPPNKEAVDFFVSKVMPILRHKGAGIQFSIYGSDVSKDIEALASEDIFIKGYVRDLGDVYNSCRVFVAPLISGAGIKGKVLGALAHGVPCVLSPIAAEGIGLRHGYDCWIVDSPTEWAEAVERVSTDEDLWNLISQRGREIIETNYSFKSGLKIMRRAFESVNLFSPR